MRKITDEVLKSPNYLLYIHTPFCGTCHIAKEMLNQIETAHNEQIFYEMNASFHADFMQANEIESVPCLLIMRGYEVKEKVYTFKSIPNIYSYLIKYNPKMFETLINDN